MKDRNQKSNNLFIIFILFAIVSIALKLFKLIPKNSTGPNGSARAQTEALEGGFEDVGSTCWDACGAKDEGIKDEAKDDKDDKDAEIDKDDKWWEKDDKSGDKSGEKSWEKTGEKSWDKSWEKSWEKTGEKSGEGK